MVLEVTEKEVDYYINRNGDAMFPNWLSSLPDIKGRAKIRARIARMRLGNMGDCEPVGEGVLELRVHYGAGYRVYLGQEDRSLVILLCGGNKKTQKGDIKKAKYLWKDYKERRDEK